MPYRQRLRHPTEPSALPSQLLREGIEHGRVGDVFADDGEDVVGGGGGEDSHLHPLGDAAAPLRHLRHQFQPLVHQSQRTPLAVTGLPRFVSGVHANGR